MRVLSARAMAVFSLLASGAPSLARGELELGLNSASYLGQGAEGRQQNYSSLTAGMDLTGGNQTLVTRSFVQGLVSFNDSEYRFIEAPELYVGTHPGLMTWGAPRRGRRSLPANDAQVTLGRKLERWSHLDEQWGLGAWQPRFRWDYLNPQQVALMGLQLAVKNGPVKATLLYSPIFVPDRGAPIDFADGRIRSISPWALNPPGQAIYQGRETQIRYAAQIPEVMDVIQHHSVSGMIRVGERQGAWASVAAAYKPMNQLPMAYDPEIAIAARSVPHIDVKIYPRVSYHSLYSLDGGWTDSRWDVWGSFLVDVPQDSFAIVPERMNQRFSRMALFSPTVTWHTSRRSAYSGRLSASYLRRFGQDLPDSGVDANGRPIEDGTSAFDSRYPYVNAVLLTARTPMIRGITAESRILADFDHLGTILSWNVEYRPQTEWSLYVAADVLTSWSDQAPEIGSDFIYRYRANDRVMGGVSYVF